MPISIDISLFAHIELDSELKGRFGVQGNTFKNTFGYLNQYLKTLRVVPPEVQKLSAAMDDLVARETLIQGIGNSPSKFDALTLKITQEVEALTLDQNILLPGGWAGKDSPGHAMIYQFEKNSKGDLFFSIYNSGSGIRYHEKTSSPEKELYSPVKTYQLPQPINSIELQNHIRRLITPQLPAMNKRKYDAEAVYHDVEVGLEFINAQYIPQDLSAPHVTTAGQISGTCAQRSIHQMLKMTIGSLPQYQQLIFDFKLYALRDFIKTHPVPRSPKITAFIQKAITNNLRILQNSDVFDDEKIRSENIKALEDINHQLNTEKVKKGISSWFKSIDFSWFRSLVSTSSPDFTHRLATKIDTFDDQSTVAFQAYPSLMPEIRETHVLLDLAEMIAQCRAQQDSNPAWVMAQIEQAFLALPIPSSAKLAPPYYEKIPFYNAITTADDFEIIGEALDELHALYTHASKELLGEATLPTQIITYCSFMALRDYFDARSEEITTKPSFHSFFHRVLFRYLNSFSTYPFLATKNPIYDKRFNELLALTCHTEEKQDQPNLLSDEQALLDALERDPFLKIFLDKKCDSADPEDEIRELRGKISEAKYQKLLLACMSEANSPQDRLKQYSDFLYDDFNLFSSIRTRLDAQDHAAQGYPIPSPIRYYKALIDSEPDLKKRLEALFESKQKVYGYIDARGLRNNELTALFVLLNDLDENGELKPDSILSAQEFAPLLKKIRQHFILEKALITYLEPLKSKEEGKEFICFTHGRTEDRRTIDPRAKTPNCSQHYEWTDQFINIKYSDYKYPLRPQEKASVAHHLYPFTPSPARDALTRSFVFYKNKKASSSNMLLDAYNSNTIQLWPLNLESHGSVIDKAHYFTRDLFHLRLSPVHQIKLTLDYFSKPESIDKLRDPNVQFYVEANLFEPNLLLRALKEDSTFFERFNTFIEKGFAKFSHQSNLTNAETLFFIRLKTFMYRYIALNSPDNALYLLQESHEVLTKRIAIEKDRSALAALHMYRFLNAITLHQYVANDDHLLQEAFFSYFYWQKTFNPFVPNDTTSLFERQRAKFFFNQWLRETSPHVIESFIAPMMHALELDISHLTITGTYPRFHYQNEAGEIIYTVNAELGRVFQENSSLSALPLEIKNHPMTKRLGLELETSCWLSEDENIIVFKSGQVRMKKAGARLIVQKKIHDQWYQLTPLNDKQQQLFGLDTTPIPINNLPAVLTDGQTEAWCNEQGALILQGNKSIYQVDNQGFFHQLNDAGQFNGCIRTNAPNTYEKLLTRFEDPQFFNINLNAKKEGTIDFVRYAISLSIVGNEIIHPETKGVLKDSSLFAPNVAALTFSCGVDERCIVAVQPFYVDASAAQIEGEYYQLTHDKSAHIPNERFKETTVWNDDHTQQTITYHVVDGQPKASTAREALYLCYLYLATHETEKAWAVLTDLGQRLSFEGSVDELTYLSWIIDHLPTILDKEKDIDYKFETPEYVACQLKALALYTDFLKLGQAPHVNVKEETTDTLYANILYKRHELEKLQQFQTDLPTKTRHLYTKHQKGVRHLSEKFTLQDEECHTLLQFCGEEAVEHGALGYERRRLSLKMLLKEYQRLVAVRETSPDFPDDFANRLVRIEKNISHELRVMKHSTQLEWVPLDLKFHSQNELMFNSELKILSRLTEELLSPVATEHFKQWRFNVFSSAIEEDLSAALDALHSAITQDDFIRYFPIYLHIARLGTVEQKNTLNQMCKHYLIAFRYASPFVEEGNCRFLSNIIYHILENSEIFSSMEDMSFYELCEKVAKLQVTPIEVAEVEDVYRDILMTNQDIWDALKHEYAPYEPMPTLNMMYPEPLYQQLGMREALQAYRDIEMQYMASMIDIHDEQFAGQLKFDCIRQQRAIADAVFQSQNTRDELSQHAQALLEKQEEDLVRIWKNALKQANKAPQNALKRLAEQRQELTKKELLSLYMHADLTLYIEKTGLPREACLALHQLIHKGVSLEVRQQQINRLLSALKSGNAHQIAETLMAENTSKSQTDSSLMLFQYAEDLLIRPRQSEALSALLSTPDDSHHYHNVVEKVIMGGGKSKVILPIMAEKKATGLNLVIVEVPRALLATNHADLNATSQRLFGQKAHRFEFNRDSDCSSKRLESICHTFEEIMTNKAYLVTTGESMQSLELKYLELLLSRPEDPKDFKGLAEWRQQVYWASKISNLVKSCGDVVIDEVHQGLLLKKKLNYTLGDVRAISPTIIKESVALYQFRDELQGQPLTSDTLLSHPNSPLKKIISTLKEQYSDIAVMDALGAYLSNKGLSDMITSSSDDIKNGLAFYKEQLSLLPRTSARHYKEHYGPSRSQQTALMRALAIPYVASNRPSERSRFGNALETVNYTIQGLLHEGLNEEILSLAMQQWQCDAQSELLSRHDAYKTLADTPTALRVNELLYGTGLTLESINLTTDDGKKEFSSFVERLKTKRNLLFVILEEHVLPQISTEPSILHSDAYNHVDMYRTAQGLSGTPWNHTTYHQRLKFNPKTSLGTDGYIEKVLKEKSTRVTQVHFTDLNSFFLSLFKDKPNTHAVIDINATFAGVSNFDVVTHLAACVIQFNPAIQYVLYFNENDVLCAYNIKTEQTMILPTSDPNEINQKLGCTPNECFTYYDQSHTVGTDLKQAATAHAFVLADNRTHLESLLQGCLRMRGLDEQQTVSIVVPENTPTSLNELIRLMSQNEQNQLKEDNFFAAMAKMDNLIRQDFLRRLADVPDKEVDKKYDMAQAFKRYFIETQQDDLFKQYGSLSVEQLTGALLEQYQERCMHEWEICLQDAVIELSPDEVKAMNANMSTLIFEAVPLCNKTSMSRNNPSQALGTEVEHEKESVKEAEKETLKETVCFDHLLNQQRAHSWVTKSERSSSALLNSFITQGITEYMHPLREKAQLSYFSDNILVDDNYAQVYRRWGQAGEENQSDMLCPYLKPVEAILFRKDGEEVTACIIDMDDLVELHALLKDNHDSNVWISTAQHTLLSGTFPSDILENKSYQAVIEQIRFFNGELNGLREQETPRHWLNQDSSEKMAYFHEKIMPYRQTTLSEVKSLQMVLNSEKHTIKPTLKRKIKETQMSKAETMNRDSAAIIKHAKGAINDLKHKEQGASMSSVVRALGGGSSED